MPIAVAHPCRRKLATSLLLAASVLATVIGMPSLANSAEPSGGQLMAYQYYEVRAWHSERCLEVYNFGQPDFSNVIQVDCWGGTNQHWRLVDVGNGFYELRAQHSDKCLDATGAHDFADVVQVVCWGGRMQHWRFVHVANGYYELRARHSDKCLVATGWQNFADVVQVGCWGGTNQRWRLAAV